MLHANAVSNQPEVALTRCCTPARLHTCTLTDLNAVASDGVDKKRLNMLMARTVAQLDKATAVINSAAGAGLNSPLTMGGEKFSAVLADRQSVLRALLHKAITMAWHAR